MRLRSHIASTQEPTFYSSHHNSLQGHLDSAHALSCPQHLLCSAARPLWYPHTKASRTPLSEQACTPGVLVTSHRAALAQRGVSDWGINALFFHLLVGQFWRTMYRCPGRVTAGTGLVIHLENFFFLVTAFTPVFFSPPPPFLSPEITAWRVELLNQHQQLSEVTLLVIGKNKPLLT